MALLLRTHYNLAKTSLRQNKGRSFLTCLGIAIGVASIILILSLTGSINRLISTQIKSLGDDLIVLRPSSQKDTLDGIIEELTTSNQYSKSNLTLEDVNTIKAIDGVVAVSPIATSQHTLQGEKVVNSGTVVGTNSNLQKILNLTLKDGTFLKELTGSSLTNTAVIGHDLSLQLFGTADSIGQTFTLQGQRFIITGTLAESEDPINFNNVNFDNAVLVQAESLAKLDQNIQIQQINIKVGSTSAVPTTAASIEQSLIKKKNGDHNWSVSYGDQISHPAGALFNIISGMLTLVAGISLIVGGIGVMNIMLVSVAERTHEIGVRKAIGATNMNIFLQFLFESLILSLLGGIIGLALGYILAFLVSTVTPFAPYISWEILLAIAYTSLIVGTLFGLFPAIKAARKNPIDSLKFFR